MIAVLKDRTSLFTRRVVIKNSKNQWEEYKSYVELAVDIFKAKNPALLQSLKDFLTCLPSPICVEQVLTTAIYQLAEIDTDACRWILRHRDYLMPELDLIELAKNWAKFKLENKGFIFEKDFFFTKDGCLNASESVRYELLQENYSDVTLAGGASFLYLLREEILQINNKI